ncbi:MAG: hypothetical protein SF052_16155 [Bacteroidia bacterium]|nr:hypothetical protein [Bacteroidia bacterium]
MAVYEKTYIDPEYVSDPGWPGVEWLPAGGEYLTLFRSAEYHLYGSSRLGLHLYGDTLKAQVFKAPGDAAFTPQGYWLDTTHLTPALPIPYFAPPSDGTYFHTLTRGEKRYELSNHLGNVLSTVSDRKLQLTDDGETVSGYTADVWGMNDYYAFGMLMPGRNQRRGGYRFGFNGQESDDEIYGKKNSYTAEFWHYDPRLGRRWNLDPRPNPSISDYSVFANNPLLFIDLLGDTIRLMTLFEGAKSYEKDIDHESYTASGIEEYLSTPEGYEFASQFAYKGQEVLGVQFKEDGKYSKHQFYFVDNQNKGFQKGATNVGFTNDLNRKTFFVNIYSRNQENYKGTAETVGHETFIHIVKWFPILDNYTSNQNYEQALYQANKGTGRFDTPDYDHDQIKKWNLKDPGLALYAEYEKSLIKKEKGILTFSPPKYPTGPYPNLIKPSTAQNYSQIFKAARGKYQ